MANQRLTKKIINICIIAVIIITIIFTAMMLILNYDVNGEVNMPFKISKISIISTVDGKNVENSGNKWEVNVIQNNDIYVYIEKNKEYNKQETISTIKLQNFQINQPQKGEIKIYKPTAKEMTIFENNDENIIQELEFKGAKTTNTKELKISNQGGVISFRCANNNVGTYISNDATELNYNQLIKNLGIKEEEISSTISFDIAIALDSGKVFEAKDIKFTIPNKDLIEKGTVGQEFTDLTSVIFKRSNNS